MFPFPDFEGQSSQGRLSVDFPCVACFCVGARGSDVHSFLLGAGAWTEEFASDVAAMGEAADDRDMASVADAMHHGAA